MNMDDLTKLSPTSTAVTIGDTLVSVVLFLKLVLRLYFVPRSLMSRN